MESEAFCGVRHLAPLYSVGLPAATVRTERQGVLSVLLTPVSLHLE